MSSCTIFVEKIAVSTTAISLLEITYKTVIPICAYKDFNRFSFLINLAPRIIMFEKQVFFATRYMEQITLSLLYFLRKNSNLYLTLRCQEIKSLNKRSGSKSK